MNEIRYIDLFAGVGGFRLGIEKAQKRVEESWQHSSDIKSSNGNGWVKHSSDTERTLISKESKQEERKQRGEWTTDEQREMLCVGQESTLCCGDTESSTDYESGTSQHGKCSFRCVYTSEWDKWAAAVYRHRLGECDERDIKKVPSDDIPEHDLLCGGFPCQSFSIAGKRGGFADTRGTMFFEIARILRDKRPKMVLLENVKGLLNHDKGNTFGTILNTLGELGYVGQYQVLNSKDYGVPQNRERVFIFGVRARCPPKVFPIGETSPDNAHTCGKEQGRGSWVSTLDSRYGQRWASETYVRPVLTPDRPEKRQNGRRIKDNGEEMFTLTGQDIHGVMVGDYRYDEGIRIRDEDISPTLRQENKGQDHSKSVLLFSGSNIRRLTPVECERLQGFPDNWTSKALVKGQVVDVSDTQRYKMMGNAVTTNVIQAIMERIINSGVLL